MNTVCKRVDFAAAAAAAYKKYRWNYLGLGPETVLYHQELENQAGQSLD